jgi:hypothetical protein
MKLFLLFVLFVHAIMLIFDDTVVLSIVHVPLLFASAIYVAASSGSPASWEHRAGVAAAIMFAPEILLYCLFWAAVAAFLAALVLMLVPLLVYRFTFRRLIIRLPRFRGDALLDECKLCEPCQRVLRESSLIYGTWMGLTRTTETHRFYCSLDEMQRSWRGCRLCETLMALPLDSPTGSDPPNYGTISAMPRSLPQEGGGGLTVTIRVHEESSIWDSDGVALRVQLRGPHGLAFAEIVVSEGNGSFKAITNVIANIVET